MWLDDVEMKRCVKICVRHSYVQFESKCDFIQRQEKMMYDDLDLKKI